MSELIVVAIIIMLLFGASKLPQMARGAGKAIKEAKEATAGASDLRDKTVGQARELREQVAGFGSEVTGELGKLHQDINDTLPRIPGRPGPDKPR